MTEVKDILDMDFGYSEYLVEFYCKNTHKSVNAINKLNHYFKNIPRLSGGYLYMFSCKNADRLFAVFYRLKDIYYLKDFEKMIINNLSSKVKLHRNDYFLKVTDGSEYISFHHFLSYCSKKTNNNELFPYVDRETNNDEPDIEEILCNKDYIKRYIKSDDYWNDLNDNNINEGMSICRKIMNQMKRQKITKMSKRFFENCKKHIFFNKFNQHLVITKNEKNYLSKKVVCDVMELDCNSKKNVRHINDMLICCGVKYNKLKMIKGNRGVFLGISLK